MNILSQMAQITQTNAASCIISQTKTVCSGGVIVAVIVVLWFLCDNLRDLRENRPFKSVRRATSNNAKHRAM